MRIKIDKFGRLSRKTGSAGQSDGIPNFRRKKLLADISQGIYKKYI
jgi:hypothetical protein